MVVTGRVFEGVKKMPSLADELFQAERRRNRLEKEHQRRKEAEALLKKRERRDRRNYWIVMALAVVVPLLGVFIAGD